MIINKIRLRKLADKCASKRETYEKNGEIYK